MTDCIAAIATAHGTGGVAVIRLSGENALGLAKKMFSPVREKAVSYTHLTLPTTIGV
jgi:tRNA modification GTPase